MIKKEHSKRLVLFDAHAIIHRAYHALPDFATKAGEPTGGLYGLSTMLLRAISEFEPDYMAACYDLPGPTFRHKEYKDYKAGRAKTDDELKVQLQRSRDVFTAFHIPIYDAPGFEADDMLGTIVEQTKKNKDLEIIIVTGDMDTLQLVKGKKVRVYTLKKGINDTIVYDEDKVQERFGFGPLQLPDYKGLRGDPSDNIIGIAGIGEKTGGDLIQKFGTIEGIYKALKKGKEKLLEAGIKARIVELLIAGEEDALFSKMLATIRLDAPIAYEVPKTTWKEGFTPDLAVKLFGDLEFKSLAVRVKSLTSEGCDGFTSTGVVAKQEVLFDFSNIPPRELREAEIGLWILNSDKTTPSTEDVLEHTGESDFAKAREKIFAELKKEKLWHIYETIELPLIPIIEAAQKKGITIDVDYMKKLSVEYHKKLAKAEKLIYKAAGEEFNINSPKQLGVVLFDKLQLTAKGLKKTEGGARSTRESELEKLRESHEIIPAILEYREYQKLLSTYIDALPELVDEKGRVHTMLVQNGSTTGRFSSNHPNLQNIPIKTDLGKNIRGAFVAQKGYEIVAADYSQIELRVVALLSGDPKLKGVFARGEDIHSAVAREVFGVEESGLTREMRRQAKVLNFGILYGMGINALRQNLETSKEEAQAFHDNYFIKFPGVAKYIAEAKHSAETKGYTETYFKRRRYFPELKSKLPFVRSAGIRMATNAPAQGTAADIIKLAMIAVDARFFEERVGEDAALLLQVHDELLFEVKKEKVIETAKIVKSAMEGVVVSDVAFPVKLSRGVSWGTLEEMDLSSS